MNENELPEHELTFRQLRLNMLDASRDHVDDAIVAFRKYQSQVAQEQGSFELRRLLNKYGDT